MIYIKSSFSGKIKIKITFVCLGVCVDFYLSKGYIFGVEIFGWNAFGFLSKVLYIAFFL